MKKRIAKLMMLVVIIIAALYFFHHRSASHSQTQKTNASIVDVPIMHLEKEQPHLPGRRLNSSHYGGDSLPESALPPAGSPWATVYDQLHARSEAGDSIAATRLFHDTMLCNNYLSVKDHIDRILRMYSGGMPSAQAIHDHDDALAKLQQQLKDDAAICDQVNATDLKKVQYSIVLQAAQSGDRVAQSCYVDAGIFARSILDPVQMKLIKQDYSVHVLQIAQDGINSGSWPMVFLLEQAYAAAPAGFGDQEWLRAIIQPDPLGMYSYLLLEQLGQQEKGTDSNMPAKLATIRDAHGISSTEIDLARSWASQVYAAHFAHSPYPESGAGTICGVE